MSKTVFLTGFPGFIAGRLLRRLIRNNGQFILLVQPPFLELAGREIDEIVQQSGRPIRDFRIVEGDVTKPRLGLTSSNAELVQRETTTIFHLAAIYDLAVTRELAVRVNLEGTRNMNQLARSISGLGHYHYISTCYVAGKREGKIQETELRHEAGFRNYYEETKYLAELEVDSLKVELPITIHRPSVVCGDSRTGETAKYDGIYYLIRYLLKWPSLLSRINIGNTLVTLNLVPVDFVVESLAVLADDSEALGKTLQLADPNPLTTWALFNAIARSISGRGSLITMPPGLVQFTLMLPPSPRITGLPHPGVQYFFLKQSYDSSQAQRLLRAHNVKCPPFESYVDRIVSFAARNPVL